jgi:hypothetical protein
MSWINNLYTLSKWKKYSQAHEECYIQHILNNIPSKNKFILELGAWDAVHLSNTKYFIDELNYDALLIDGDNHGNSVVKEHFITKENILGILEKYECPKEFDFLCIDLDGNDIYILDEILTKYKPLLIVAEFNPIFQHSESVAIEYNDSHTWDIDNYYGFSFSAGLAMAKKNGYTCIFQNDNLNMYFIENSLVDVDFQAPTYIPTHYHPQSRKNNWVVYG